MSLPNVRRVVLSVFLSLCVGGLGALWGAGCTPPMGPPGVRGPAVVAFPLPGIVAPGTQISLSAEQNASIFFTTDGTEPLPRVSSIYQQPLQLWSSTTLRVVAVDRAGKRGAEARFVYKVDTLIAKTRTEPAPGKFEKPISVQLLADEPVVIYYTTDGTRPTAKSQRYKNPIRLKEDTILRYFSIDAQGNQEPIQEARFEFPPRLEVWPPPGVYETNELVVYVRANKKADIQYSFGGVEKEFWWPYQGPLRIKHDADLKIRAIDKNKLRSAELRVQYALLVSRTRGDVASWETAPQAMVVGDPEGLGQSALWLLGQETIRLLSSGAQGPSVPQSVGKIRETIRWARTWDWDGDGLNDLLYGTQEGKVWLAQSASRKLLKKPVVPDFLKAAEVVSLVPLDFDGDGQLDLFVLDRRAKQSRLWKRKGGGYTPVKTKGLELGAGGYGALAGDWNGDNKTDLFVLLGEKKTPVLLSGDGNGTFQTYSFRDVLRPFGAQANWLHAARADFDGDGDLDLALLGRVDKPSNNDPKVSSSVLVFVLLRQRKGEGWKADVSTEIPDGPVRGLLLVDLDTDGYPDVYLSGRDGFATLFKNVLGQRFYDVTTRAGVRWSEATCAGVGDLGQSGSAALLLGGKTGFVRVIGDQPRGKSLRLVVRGVQGNRNAIGATLLWEREGRRFLREIGVDSTGPDQRDLLVPWGAGRDEQLGRLLVRWSDGQTRTLTKLSTSNLLSIAPNP